MKHLFHKLSLLGMVMLLATSCGTYEKYVLLNDVEVPKDYVATVRHDMKIKKGDNLQILVAHHLPKVVEVFNQKLSSIDGNNEKINTYVVNSDGFLNMPVFDSVRVVGMTCRELEKYLVDRMEAEGIAYGATVNVKIVNFKVTVIGESGRGVYTFNDDGATVFDLLATAGLAGGGNGGNGGNGEAGIRRDKILVMREQDSVWHTEYISLLSTDLLYSPYFYLQQNDVFYVYPSKTAIRRSNQVVDFWVQRLSIVTTLVSMVALVLSAIK